jgi:ribonuclease P protein component
VSVTYLPASPPTTGEPARVAFAIPRKVGTAVVRNRLRRQVRNHLDARAREGTAMTSGAYLVAIAPGAASVGRDQMLADLDACVRRLDRRG